MYTENITVSKRPKKFKKSEFLISVFISAFMMISPKSIKCWGMREIVYHSRHEK